MSLPYFNMYPKDFEAGTSHLTLEEDGAYNRLLRLMWLSPSCSLPDDDAWIMRRLRVDQEAFDRVVLTILDEFFERKRGRVSNARLTEEFNKSNDAHKKRVLAGKKGGNSKSLKNNDSISSNAKAMPKQPEPEPELKEKRYKKDKADDGFDLGEPPVKQARDWFSEFWQVYPKKVGKPASLKAFQKAVTRANPETIIQGAKNYADWLANAAPGEFRPIIKHPQGWLADDRWNDPEIQSQSRASNFWYGDEVHQ